MPSTLSRIFFGLGCFTPMLGLGLLFHLFSNRSFMAGIVSLVICLFVMLVGVGIGSLLEQKQKEKQLAFLHTFQPDQFDFQKQKSYTSYDLLTKIALDEQRKKLHIWMPDPKKVGITNKAYIRMPYIINTYNYSDILAVNLKEDYERTDSVHRDTDFTHFILNQLKEDDIVKSKTTKPQVDKVSSMDLELIVDDKASPSHLIRFYYAPYIYIRKDSPEYEAYNKERQEWFTKLKGIVEQQNDTAVSIERPIETMEPPVLIEPSDEDLTEKTQILVEVETSQYSLQLHEEIEDTSEPAPEVVQVEPQQEVAAEKPLSYFEQLIEKNRRQLRGDSTDE
ncbi:hypothetical protein MHZ92_20420 [Sporosarcina sp. ACRSL]|uniref:hypothetical protein n=1 Tax=Sporosarcina sp. ACRSL TaxID=2918215 RepID=UPI001EF52542|nr:hypothetical protein [Sporosarcina sp. ACRSL]MCG7346473.1 hypothetical protein [Sporosarcina sp. ACRSL]